MEAVANDILIPGYGKYVIRDGKIVEVESGNEVKVNKKGMVALTGDDNEPKALNAADLISSLGGTPAQSEGSNLPAATSEGGEAKEPTEDEKVANEFKRLRKNLKDATLGLTTSKKDKLGEAKDAFDKAQAELDAFKEAHPTQSTGGGGKQKKEKEPAAPPTEEQLAAQKAFDEIDAIKKETDAKWKTTLEELKKYKVVRNTGDPASHARKMEYRTVQEIRQKLAAGAKPKEIMDAYGISASAVNYYRNYLQHKLKKAPAGADMNDAENALLYTAHLPLVNDYYPENWKSKDGVLRHGAPYFEDNVKEDDTRYDRYPALNADGTPIATAA